MKESKDSTGAPQRAKSAEYGCNEAMTNMGKLFISHSSRETAACLLTGAPSEVDMDQLRELSIRIRKSQAEV